MGDQATELIRSILSENPKKSIYDSSLTPAGVTLLLYPKDGEHHVLLQKRSEQVEHHKGEISFPGGMVDDDDESLLHTALREAYEEMGILQEHVEVLGQVDDVPTNSNFLVHTFVGTIPYPYEFTPSEIEVAQIIVMPLSVLLDSANSRDEVRIVNGKLVYAPVFVYGCHIIFGATARILNSFRELLVNAPMKEAQWQINRP